jgi:hypothetical protein
MFESLFPIFAFGLVVTGVVWKGLLIAADEAKAHREAHERTLVPMRPSETQPDSTVPRGVASKPAVAA